MLGNSEPKTELLGSSSSKVSIKATLSGIETGNTHKKVSPESTTQTTSYIIEFAVEFNYYKTVLKIRQVLQRSYLQQFIRVSLFAAKG